MTAPIVEKYRVQKISDGEILAPGTFFVLRAADRLSYAALWQYAQSLQLQMEVSPENAERLRAIADQVEALAAIWQAQSSKYPD